MSLRKVGLIPYVGKPAQGIARAIRTGSKAAIKKALKAGVGPDLCWSPLLPYDCTMLAASCKVSVKKVKAQLQG